MPLHFPIISFSCWLSIALSLAVSVAAQAADTENYSNARYGFGISYPAGLFLPQGESDNGDGQIFRSPDGQAELRVFAMYNVLDETLADKFKEALAEPGLQATYKVTHKTWFVVSGKQQGRIVYQKTILAKGTFFTLLLTYAASAQATYDPVVGDLVRKFVIF